ncbi:ribonuclease [Eubacterium ruminantium]|nr:ribonuclease [Eubacterium ruminantium]
MKGLTKIFKNSKFRALGLLITLALTLFVVGCGKKKEDNSTVSTVNVITEKSTEGKTTGTETTEGKSTEDKTTEGKSKEDKTTENKTTEGKTTEDKNTEEKTTDNKSTEQLTDTKEDSTGEKTPEIDEDGDYYSKDEVALYIHIYGKLPQNYITKNEAKKLGWEGGKLEPYAPGKSIGGDKFGNYEGILPDKSGRKYTECDIDTKGKARGAKRIVFSNDGLIYYTEDHYESFELLYGEE